MLHRNRADRPARASPVTSMKIASQVVHQGAAAIISTFEKRTKDDATAGASRATTI